MKKKLLNKISLITPNIPETEILTGIKVKNQNDIKIFLELKNKLNPLCKNFVDFGNYFSENIELD